MGTQNAVNIMQDAVLFQLDLFKYLLPLIIILVAIIIYRGYCNKDNKKDNEYKVNKRQLEADKKKLEQIQIEQCKKAYSKKERNNNF